MMTAENIILILIGGGVIGFLGGLIALWVNRNKLKAETDKLLEDVRKIMISELADMQGQISDLRDKNKVLYDEREELRLSRDKLRSELDRVHTALELLKQDLSTENARNFALTEQVTALTRASFEKGAKIELLESQLKDVGIDLNIVKKKTGGLSESMIPDHTKDKP